MLVLEALYGKIPLGYEAAKSTQSDQEERKETYKSLWLHLSEFINYNRKEMANFKRTIQKC